MYRACGSPSGICRRLLEGEKKEVPHECQENVEDRQTGQRAARVAAFKLKSYRLSRKGRARSSAMTR